MDSTLVCYNNGIDTEETLPNKHLEHPEDMIMYGRRAALRTVNALLHKHLPLGVKWDGAPAIVFGTNPENGKFFVGTKSVFNKVKVKIAYSYEDIDAYYKGEVATYFAYAFVTFLGLVVLSKATILGYLGVVPILLMLLSIGLLPKPLVILSLPLILVMTLFLQLPLLVLVLMFAVSRLLYAWGKRSNCIY